MTFCFFSTQYLPTPGGVERYTFNLALQALAGGHRAIVVTSALPGLPEWEIDENGIELYRLPVFPLMGGRFPVVRFGPRFSALARRLWAAAPDFCVVQTKMYLESVWAARAAARRGIPFLVIDHSTGYMPMGNGFLGWAGRRYEHWACNRIRAAGAPFFGVSRSVCSWLRSFGITAAGELPNAVDPAALAAGAAAAPAHNWRAELGLSPSTRLVAFVGRLIPEKGAAELAQAVAGLPGTAMVAAGTGPQLEALRAAAPKNVFYAGALPHDQILQLLTQADAYCLPTRYAEGFPTTLLEAAALRCPIVCSPTAGTDELLPGPEYGTLLADTAPQTIAAALKKLFAPDSPGQTQVENAYKNVCSHFTWELVFDKILKMAQAQTFPVPPKEL